MKKKRIFTIFKGLSLKQIIQIFFGGWESDFKLSKPYKDDYKNS